MMAGLKQAARVMDHVLAEMDDADAYGRLARKFDPAIKARADAEWEASDEFGRLPKGWEYNPDA